jgi:sulfite exporter TauE/SafE
MYIGYIYICTEPITSLKRKMADNITTTETMTAYSLIGGIMAGVGGIMLSQKIKEKKVVPVSTLLIWTGILGAATVASVIIISKSAK